MRDLYFVTFKRVTVILSSGPLFPVLSGLHGNWLIGRFEREAERRRDQSGLQ